MYEEPLTAALNSNRAILSFADVHIVLSPVTLILELNRYKRTLHISTFDLLVVRVCGPPRAFVRCRAFLVDLQARLQQWSADQCVGDVFVKLCSKLRVYTNYLNNYTTALHTVDKVE